jgi:signal transduction histidine kinase
MMREPAPFEHDAAGPLNELAETLVLVSALVSRLKRAAEAAALGVDFGAIDEAFSRSIELARTVRERVGKRGRSDYSSLTNVVREVAGRYEETASTGHSINGRYPNGAAIVAAEGSLLRRLVQMLLDTALAAIGGPGSIEVEVIDTAPLERARRSVRLEVRTPAEIDENDARLVRLRPMAHVLGGTLQVRAPIRGGTAISLRLLAAC